jgi:hypothetical protein
MRKAARLSTQLFTTAFELLARPTQFALRRIDVAPGDLQRSVSFYIKWFTINFAVGASFTYLNYFSGASQPRELAIIGLQIALALPIIYLLNVITRQRVSLSGVAQGIFYIDAIFLCFQNLLAILLAYLSFEQKYHGEVDIISTEFTRCLTNHSHLYWLIHGNIEYYNHAEPSSPIVSTLKENIQYALILPFCFAFGKLLKARYGSPVWLNFIFAVVTYPIVVNATYYTINRTATAIAQASPCAEFAAQSAFATYNQAIVLRQIGERINGQLRIAIPGNPPNVARDDDGFVIAMQARRPLTLEEKTHSIRAFSEAAHNLYCQNTTDFRLARAIGVPLLVTLRDPAGQIIHQERIRPSQCGPAP